VRDGVGRVFQRIKHLGLDRELSDGRKSKLASKMLLALHENLEGEENDYAGIVM